MSIKTSILCMVGGLLISGPCQASPSPECYVRIACINQFEEKVVASQPLPAEAGSETCALNDADSDVCARICGQQSSMLASCTVVFAPPNACMNPPCGKN